MTADEDSLVKRSVSIQKEGFEPMCAYAINTLGKREVSLLLSFNQLLNHMNFYIQATYSCDGGNTWHSSSQLHQVPDGKKESSNYVLELPRSFDDKKEVLIEFFKRNNDVEVQLDIQITEAIFLSKTYEEYSFEIAEKESMKVESTISNETEGNDGYVTLRVDKGTPPYTYVWDDVKGTARKDSLCSGKYTVRVTDSKGCSVLAQYYIEPPENTVQRPVFNLVQIEDQKTFKLTISNLYRQMMELTLVDSKGKEVKEFRINPLYEDLEIDLELLDIMAGSYTATLSTDAFSKNLILQVK